MAIARYENITVNNVVNSVDSFGQYTTTLTKWFETRARVHAVKNSLNIRKDERIYSDLVNFTLNYTPNTKTIIDFQNLYSIYWRNANWRIDSAVETDDRMNVIFYCYRNDPTTAV